MSDNAAATPPEDSGEQVETLTLGGRLRAARRAHELSIEKIADELRIEEHVLVALEEDRLSDIDVAPVFIKGYIKQYGRLLRLDYDELRQAFREQVDAEDVSLKPNSSIQLRDERQITIWIIAALAVLLVGVALFVWWVGEGGLPSFGSGDADIESVVPVSAPVGAQGAGAAAAAAAVSSQSIALPNPPPVDTVASQSSTSSSSIAPAPASQPVPGARSQDTPPAAVAALQDDAAEALPDAAAPPDTSTTVAQASAASPPDAQAPIASTVAIAPPPPGSIPMRFEFSQQSWFEFEDAAGRRLFYDLAEPGRTLDFEALPPARVLIGNAAAVDITVASAPYAVPPASLRGNVASFLIAAEQD